MTKRFRIYLQGHCVGVSIYAYKFQINEETNDVEFSDKIGNSIAFFQTEHIEHIMIGASCDEVAWSNPQYSPLEVR